MSILHAIDAVLPPAGSPIAGFLSVTLAITIAFWDPIVLLVRRVKHRPIMIIEENWKLLLNAHRAKVGSEAPLDEFLIERARSNQNIIREIRSRASGEIWFLVRNRRDGLARVPVEDILGGFKEAA